MNWCAEINADASIKKHLLILGGQGQMALLEFERYWYQKQ